MRTVTSSLPRLEPGASHKGLIQGPAGALEYRLEMPAGAPRALAVICHPHPLYQGTMDNKVVYTLSRAALAVGGVALRFQFRGVGGSEGPHDHGRGETQDTAWFLQRLQEAWPELPSVLLGFSFGSYMALQVAAEQQVAGLVAIAPPLAYAGAAVSPEPLCPWLVVHGDADDVVPYAETMDRIAKMSRTPELVTVSGVGHFFHGRLGELRDAVEPWLSKVIALN